MKILNFLLLFLLSGTCFATIEESHQMPLWIKHWKIAELAVKASQRTNAIENYEITIEEILKLDSKSDLLPKLYTILGKLYLDFKDYTKAQEAFNNAIESSTIVTQDLIDAHKYLADIYCALGSDSNLIQKAFILNKYQLKKCVFSVGDWSICLDPDINSYSENDAQEIKKIYLANGLLDNEDDFYILDNKCINKFPPLPMTCEPLDPEVEKIANEALYIKGKEKKRNKKKDDKDRKEDKEECDEEEDNLCTLAVEAAAYCCEGACFKLNALNKAGCLTVLSFAKRAGMRCCKLGSLGCAKKIYQKTEKYFSDIGYFLQDELDPHDIENFNKYYRTGKPQDHARLNRYDLDIAIGQRVVNPDKVFKTLPIVTEEDSKFE